MAVHILFWSFARIVERLLSQHVLGPMFMTYYHAHDHVTCVILVLPQGLSAANLQPAAAGGLVQQEELRMRLQLAATAAVATYGLSNKGMGQLNASPSLSSTSLVATAATGGEDFMEGGDYMEEAALSASEVATEADQGGLRVLETRPRLVAAAAAGGCRGGSNELGVERGHVVAPVGLQAPAGGPAGTGTIAHAAREAAAAAARKRELQGHRSRSMSLHETPPGTAGIQAGAGTTAAAVAAGDQPPPSTSGDQGGAGTLAAGDQPLPSTSGDQGRAGTAAAAAGGQPLPSTSGDQGGAGTAAAAGGQPLPSTSGDQGGAGTAAGVIAATAAEGGGRGMTAGAEVASAEGVTAAAVEVTRVATTAARTSTAAAGAAATTAATSAAAVEGAAIAAATSAAAAAAVEGAATSAVPAVPSAVALQIGTGLTAAEALATAAAVVLDGMTAAAEVAAAPAPAAALPTSGLSAAASAAAAAGNGQQGGRRYVAVAAEVRWLLWALLSYSKGSREGWCKPG